MNREGRDGVAARIVRFFGHGGGVAYWLIGAMLALSALSASIFASTLGMKLRRDVARGLVDGGSDAVEALEWTARERAAAAEEASEAARQAADALYVVVSTEERRLWLKRGEEVRFEAPVATGSGKTLVQEGSNATWRFETPRGRLVVQSKEENPLWRPPDWHFVEQSKKRGVPLVHLSRDGALSTRDGGQITVSGNDVVRRGPDGRETVLSAQDGREIVVDGRLIVPPPGSNQRAYEGVLGTHRLNLGNGYALHGTNRPETVGQAVSHGCVRLRNEDIARLYAAVPVGTPVYIY